MAETIKTPVCIVGAGPGGAAAAMFLAKAGIACMLVDKAVFPRDKICGDAISGKVVEALRRLDPDVVERLGAQGACLGSWGVTFVAPNLKELRVPFKRDFDKATETAPGFIIPRMDFDHFLVKETERYAEIDLRQGVDLSKYERTTEGWRITDKSSALIIETPLLIIANGAQSNFTRHHTEIKQEPKHYCAGLRAYYKGVKGLDADNFIELHFLKDFLPGYFWIFPLPNGMANVGVGMRSDQVSRKKVNLRQRMVEIIGEVPQLRERFAGAELVGKIEGYGLPLGSKKRPLSGEGYMLVGDAGYLIDPFTGEGIGNAVFSGMYAAEMAGQAIQSGNYSAAFLQRYDQKTFSRLWQELQLSTRMQRLVKYPWLFNLVVNKANRNSTLRETISCMFEDLDLRDRLRQPSFYWKLLFG